VRCVSCIALVFLFISVPAPLCWHTMFTLTFVFTNTHDIYRYSTSFNRTNLSYTVVKSGKKKDTLKSMAERIKTRYKGESGEF
jgi:hypothetical protein